MLPPSLPRAFPPLRSLWQEAVLSADGHGEGISEVEGSLLALLQEEEISAFPAASPPPPGHAGHGLGGPSTEEGENPAPRRALAHLPLPCKPPGAGDPLSPCPFFPCPKRCNRARGCSEDSAPLQLLRAPGSLVPSLQVLVLHLVEVLQQLRVVDVGGRRPLGACARPAAVPAGEEGERVRAGHPATRAPVPKRGAGTLLSPAKSSCPPAEAGDGGWGGREATRHVWCTRWRSWPRQGSASVSLPSFRKAQINI